MESDDSKRLLSDALSSLMFNTDDYLFVKDMSSLKDEQGSIRKVLCSAVDITERKKAEERLRTEKVRLKTMTDRVNLQKILLNLLGNAVKFTPKGGTVSFSFSRLDPPVEGRNARFMVTDTGEGMSEEFIQEKLYQPFCQEHRDEGDSHVVARPV